MNDLRYLPSVDKVLLQASALIDTYGRSITTEAIRVILDEARAAIRAGRTPPDRVELLSRIACERGPPPGPAR